MKAINTENNRDLKFMTSDRADEGIVLTEAERTNMLQRLLNDQQFLYQLEITQSYDLLNFRCSSYRSLHLLLSFFSSVLLLISLSLSLSLPTLSLMISAVMKPSTLL